MLSFIPTFKQPNTSDIEKLKQEIGFQLPADYVHFLQRINGGFIGARVNALNNPERIYRVGYLFGLDWENSNPEEKFENIRYAYDDESINQNFPKQVIKIGSGVIHNTVMSLLKEDYGHVYCGHREEGEEHDYDEARARLTSNAEELAMVGYQCVAQSFSEFLERLYEEDEE